MPAAKSILPIQLPVLHGEQPALVTLDFANHGDVIASARWRVPSELRHDKAMRRRAADAREFAQLAAKRWWHYRNTRCAARSLNQLHRLTTQEPQGEFCFHLKVTASWFRGSLGGAMVRRTWCHHLMVDFLFVHPRISGRVESVKGVGFGIVQSVCLIAKELNCAKVWGEATRDSAPFYQRHLRRPVDDCFWITVSERDAFAAMIEAESLRT